jgi:23S rRNA (guanosine2251-2'-O)-methyltransferase
MSEFLYGRQSIKESLKAGRRTHQHLYIAKGTSQATIIDEIIKLGQKLHIPVDYVIREDISLKTKNKDHQGVALKTSRYPYSDIDRMITLANDCKEPPLLLILDLIQDIHNFGSLVRTAEAIGVHGLIIQERRAASVTPAAVNASSGAFEHILVSKVTNLAREILRLKDLDIWIVGLEWMPKSKDYTDFDLTGPLAIVIGSEGRGIRRLIRDRCDWLMKIPMRGSVNSLNAAVAGSVVLYEALNQRRNSI